MKTMVIGLRPDYNYPGSYEKWMTNTTRFASNLGASLITDAILRQFDSDFIDDFSNISELKNRYDTCVLAFSTHITTFRDVSFYLDIIEKLDMKTVVLSLGIQDYSWNINEIIELHPSMTRLLTYVSKASNWIGVRGHYSAAVLYQHGFKNVVPIGCPSMYWRLNNDFRIHKGEVPKKPLIVFHRSIAEAVSKLMGSVTLLGQDFEDHFIFTDELRDDKSLKSIVEGYFSELESGHELIEKIKNYGTFVKTFSEWFDIVGSHDFVFGTRLHGCISALIQGIPAVMIPRDLRVHEMSEFFQLPTLSMDELSKNSIEEIYHRADFSSFNSGYKMRYNNYCNFLRENQLVHNLNESDQGPYHYSHLDILTSNRILHKQNVLLQRELKSIKTLVDNRGFFSNLIKNLYVQLVKIIKKIPLLGWFLRKIKSLFRKK